MEKRKTKKPKLPKEVYYQSFLGEGMIKFRGPNCTQDFIEFLKRKDRKNYEKFRQSDEKKL